jgi:hypothetical protein
MNADMRVVIIGSPVFASTDFDSLTTSAALPLS